MESVRVEKLIPGGQALGTLSDGKKIMFWGALPGETVTKWRATKSKSTYIEAIAAEISEPSTHRIEPQDSYYLANSPWQIFDYSYELSQKRELLLEIFRQQKIELGNVAVAPVQTDGQDLFYRNKMEYALYYHIDEQKIYPAIRERGTHHKVPITTSSLEKPELWQAANDIIDQLNSRHEEARKYQSLLLRCNQQGEVSGGLFENHRPHPHFAKLTDTILGQTYTYSPNGFFQINLPVYEMVLREIKQHIATPNVLDLYAGVGTIGLSVARDRQLTLVECDKSAYRELEHNCAGTKAQPVLAKSEEALAYIQPDQTVIVDPPRAGCLPSVVEKLSDVQPRTIIYLSCNPITQARDLQLLTQHYDIKLIQPFNFFPRTPHLENLVILERKSCH